MKDKEKCLVSEAMDKCQCEWCKLSRQARDISLKCYVRNEIIKTLAKGMSLTEEEKNEIRN